MDISELQSSLDKWIKEYGVRYFSELTNMTLLTEEVGELARLMGREFGEQSYKKADQQKDAKSAISDELADIIFVVTCLANQMDIDLESAIEKNLNKKTNRDSSRHINNVKLKN